jgi:phosphoribosylformylglycinamidine synthase
LLRSAHDAAEGGILVTLAEASIGGPYAPSGLGAEIDLEGYAPGIDPESLLYGEDAGRVVLSADPAHSAALAELARERAVPLFRAGRVGSGRLELRVGSRRLSWDVSRLRSIYFEAIPRRMQHADAERSAGE